MHVIVMAKAPVPGRVKTRLVPEYSFGNQWGTVAMVSLPLGVDPKPYFDRLLGELREKGARVNFTMCGPPGAASPYPTPETEAIRRVFEAVSPGVPVIPIVVRLVKKPWRLGEYVVPAETAVAMSIVALHHREDVYPEPHSFRPERFLGRKPGTYTWIPFGGGIRRCLGLPESLPGPRPKFFFAPDRVVKRTADWGSAGLEQRLAEAWEPFAQWTGGWLELIRARGGEELRAAYLELLDGRIDPAKAHVISLRD